MTLRELRSEIDLMVSRFPEIEDLPVFGESEQPPNGFEVDRLILHDPDGDGFTYVSLGTK